MRCFVAAVALSLAVGPPLAADESEAIYPGAEWSTASPADAGLDAKLLRRARDYALTGGGSGYIVRGGKLVMAWGDPDKRYDLKSSTKSIGATVLGLALLDDKVRLTDPAQKHHPRFGTPPQGNGQTGWLDQITLLHLATQTAGFEKPGGYGKLLFEPGTKWSYSDGGPNWLAECLTLAYHRDLDDLLFERVFAPLDIARDDLKWRKNAYRSDKIDGVPRREFGSGISANVDAMARVGYLYLRRGRWRDRQLIPRKFVERVGTTVPNVVGLPETKPKQYGNASDHYGLLWWNNADGALSRVPRDAYWSWGLYDSLIVVIPSLDLVVARAGRSWKRTDGGDHYDVLRPFLEPIALAARREGEAPAEPRSSLDNAARRSARTLEKPPYPASPVIARIDWAPADTILRKAKGSDNWPLTWGDDDLLYAAYGDGRGFNPFTETKLSLGLARIAGSPPEIVGANLRAPTAEQKGGGAAGKKASGLLMVEGVLYMWTRNADNAQLAWSRDHGQTWTWSDWRLTESFGCPTFLQFGRNYAGVRDGFVYVYSHDSESAYQPSDRMVLARVPKARLADRSAYEFFAGLDERGRPRWTDDIRRRGAVFENPGRCYRSGVSYNAPLDRYLWCQTLPGGDPRFAGGFGIYDAPEPWGPWTTVFYAPRWDVGPGETSSFPTKWIGPDGTRLFLVFSGDDGFSVRGATLTLKRP